MLKDIKRRVSKCYTPSLTAEKKPLPPSPGSKRTEKQPIQRQSVTDRLTTSPKGGRTGSNTSSLSTLSMPPTPTSLAPNFYRMQSSSSLMSIGSEQLLDHSHLKPGANAELLSYSKTINMYRENAKKTHNLDIQCDFAIFLVEAAKRLGQKQVEEDTVATTEQDRDLKKAYLLEAEKLLKQAAFRGHAESQYYLANMYAAGLLQKTGQPDFDKAFPLFVQAAKHHNPDAAFR